MVEQVPLVRATSSVPVSTHQVESSVLPVSIDKATNFTQGGPNQLDAIVTIEYTDGAKWELRITELSEIKHSLGYQVLSTEPTHSATSIQGQVHLRAVTDDNTTFITWTTDFSNDADATVIYDQKFKKTEFFAELKKNLSGGK
ncbi:hypothetical protein FGO68_gene6532 [Halteria grandinella]|uniref:Uncharacterized protein n=1 Tax=Halteria grandinella TaxID=5974 RepID=A0A8J8NKZ8_HALGN|nr:hypothetical protein FGO68_gene6532 [Halteria grandinella]